MALIDKKGRTFGVGDTVYLACIVEESHEHRDGTQSVVLRVFNDKDEVDRKRIESLDPVLMLTKAEAKEKTK